MATPDLRLGPLSLASGLGTDLYELTMAASYLREGMHGEATFSLFVRKLPEERRFLVAAGLEEVVDALERYHFTDDDLRYLQSLNRFDPAVLAWLREYRFTGELRAVPEGTVVFEQEPLLEVSGPLPQVQVLETLVLNLIHLHTVLATKAARTVLAARGRPVVDFGFRRAHGVHAGNAAARAAYLAGAASTSNVLAGRCYGIPVAGTMAHSYVQAFEREEAAFDSFARSYPDTTVLLIDTYDTVRGAARAIETARVLAQRGSSLSAVRLDSGDLLDLSRVVRGMLDQAGFRQVQIFASGGLDEYAIHELLVAGAPIDAFGVGTRMTTSSDAPALDMAYKLVAYDGRPTMKTSGRKATWPDAKQVFRMRDAGGEGQFARDIIAQHGEPRPPDCQEELLRPAMQAGARIEPLPTLPAVREYCAHQLSALPLSLQMPRGAGRFPVEFSAALVNLRRELRRELGTPDCAELLPAP